MNSEIHNPGVRRSFSDVLPVNPRTENITIRSAIRINRQLKPFPCHCTRNCEPSNLLDALKRNPVVRLESEDLCKISPNCGSQRPTGRVRVYLRYGATIEHDRVCCGCGNILLFKTNNRYADSGSLDDPRLITVRVENDATIENPIEHFAVAFASA